MNIELELWHLAAGIGGLMALLLVYFIARKLTGIGKVMLLLPPVFGGFGYCVAPADCNNWKIGGACALVGILVSIIVIVGSSPCKEPFIKGQTYD